MSTVCPSGHFELTILAGAFPDSIVLRSERIDRGLSDSADGLAGEAGEYSAGCDDAGDESEGVAVDSVAQG